MPNSVLTFAPPKGARGASPASRRLATKTAEDDLETRRLIRRLAQISIPTRFDLIVLASGETKPISSGVVLKDFKNALDEEMSVTTLARTIVGLLEKGYLQELSQPLKVGNTKRLVQGYSVTASGADFLKRTVEWLEKIPA